MKWIRQVYYLVRLLPVMIKAVRDAWNGGRADVQFARQRERYERDNSGDGIFPIDERSEKM